MTNTKKRTIKSYHAMGSGMNYVELDFGYDQQKTIQNMSELYSRSTGRQYQQ